MRSARQDDFWRAVKRKAGWRISIDRVDYDAIPSIGSGTITFLAPISFMCGPNGVGKTTLLRAIGAALRPQEAATSPSTAFRLKGGGLMSIISWMIPRTT